MKNTGVRYKVCPKREVRVMEHVEKGLDTLQLVLPDFVVLPVRMATITDCTALTCQGRNSINDL